MFIGKYNASVILTYVGVALAIVGMWFALEGSSYHAMICLVLAGVCDLFDGTAARLFKRDEKELAFGREIDSLADMVSFIALPAVFAMMLPGRAWLTVPAMILYALAGIIRLAWFNIAGTGESDGERFYHGLPVTYAALIFPILYIPLSFLPGGVTGVLWPLLYLITAAAFILDIRIRKPDRKQSLMLALLAAIVIIIYLLLGVFS